MVTVITYGTFDTLHYGHINLLLNARSLGDKLIVALSSDEFNATKGKTSHFDYDVRKRYLEALTCVDLIIPEMSWEQKVTDIKKYEVDIFTMGSDWTGKFDELSDFCKVQYLGRTPAISSTLIKENIPTSQPELSRNQ